MTDKEIADQLHNIALLVSDLLKRVERSTPTSVTSDLPKDLISASAAAKVSRKSKTRIRALCKAHLGQPNGSGFAYKLGKRWFVSQGRFLQFIRSPS